MRELETQFDVGALPQVIEIPEVDDRTPESANQRAALQGRSTRSFLGIPLLSDLGLVGFWWRHVIPKMEKPAREIKRRRETLAPDAIEIKQIA